MGNDRCRKLDKAGHENSNVCWERLMVERALGACKKHDFEYKQHNRSMTVRGDVSQMDDDARVLKRTLDAEYVESRRNNTSTVNCGATLPTDSNEPTEASEMEEEWLLYQIDDIGVNTHITLGCLPTGNGQPFLRTDCRKCGLQSRMWRHCVV